MKLCFLSGRYQGRAVELRPTGTTIGRARDNDLVLTDDGISRHHCRIYAVDDRWLVQDRNSMNGVCVNGERITGSRELKPGNRVTIHRVALLCMDEGAVPPDNGSDPEPERGTAMPVPPKPQEVSGGAARERPRRPVRARLPWFRILLLLLAMALVAWLLVKALFETGPDGTPALAPGAASPCLSMDCRKGSTLGKRRLGEDALGAYLDFGPGIRCFLKPGTASAVCREQGRSAGT